MLKSNKLNFALGYTEKIGEIDLSITKLAKDNAWIQNVFLLIVKKIEIQREG